MPEYWLHDEAFGRLCEGLVKHPCFDEVAFFTDETHSLSDYNTIIDRIPLLCLRMQKLREMGFSVGVNVLTSMGHHSENAAHRQSGMRNFCDINGTFEEGVYCLAQKELLDYCSGIYGSVAKQTNPEFIWIDDDVRFQFHGRSGFGCFCDDCINRFGEYTGGVTYTRETLKQAFNDGNENAIELRRKYIEFDRTVLDNFIGCIEKSIHSINADIKIGFMCCSDFGDIEFPRLSAVMSGECRTPVKWRPGGGFYNEDLPTGFLNKAHRTGRQCTMINKTSDDIQVEIENFPYALLKKSSKITVLETVSYLAVGCSGAAYNILSDRYFERYFKTIGDYRGLFNLISESSQTGRCDGIGFAWNDNTHIAPGNHINSWPSSVNWYMPDDFLMMGLPVSYDKLSNQTQTAVVMGDQILSFSREDILTLLSKGVFIDHITLGHMNRMGYGEYTGFEVAQTYQSDCIEQLTGHSINGEFAWSKRDGRQSFWHCEAASLIPKKGALIFSRLVDYADEVICECASGIYENSIGGRIYVSGYYPMTHIFTAAKTYQMKNVFRWLAKDCLSGYINSYHKINIWIHKSDDKSGTPRVTMINTSFDDAEEIELLLRTDIDEMTFYAENMDSIKITASDSDSAGYRKFILPKLKAFSAGFFC